MSNIYIVAARQLYRRRSQNMGHCVQQFNKAVSHACMQRAQSRLPVADRKLWISREQYSSTARCLRFPQRFYRIHLTTCCWFAFVSWFSRWLSVPCVSFDSVHSSSFEAILHARAWCRSWAFGTCSALCWSSVCTILTRNRISLIGGTRWFYWTSCDMLLVHSWVWIVSSEWWIKSIWRWTFVIVWRIGVLSHW